MGAADFALKPGEGGGRPLGVPLALLTLADAGSSCDCNKQTMLLCKWQQQQPTTVQSAHQSCRGLDDCISQRIKAFHISQCVYLNDDINIQISCKNWSISAVLNRGAVQCAQNLAVHMLCHRCRTMGDVRLSSRLPQLGVFKSSLSWPHADDV